MTAEPRLFVFGLGYTACVLAEELLMRGWRVAGTTRGAERAEDLRALGIEPHLFDRGRPLDDPAAALDGTTHLLSSVPPDEEGDPVLDHHGDDIAAVAGLAWAGYLSTTGVYGNSDGAWVDETSPLNPGSARTRRRAAAERAWLDLWRVASVPVHVFRLAGIYGPGRNQVETVKAGRARRLERPGHVFSRIHVEDIARVLAASMEAPAPGAVYNVCDDEPAEPQAVIAYAASLLDVAPPPLVPFDEADLSPMARTFWQDNRRVSNRRIREELGVELAYPTFREGLASLADQA